MSAIASKSRQERRLPALYLPAISALAGPPVTVIFWVSVAYILRTVRLRQFYFSAKREPLLNTVKTLVFFYRIQLVAAVSR